MIKDDINKIIKSIPKNLTEIEIAYYIYLELSKIFRFDTEYRFPISSNSLYEVFYECSTDLNSISSPDVICKSFSLIYVEILKSLGINAECFNYSNITHVDVILNANNKLYYINPVGDLFKIQTGLKTYNFAKNPKFIDINLLQELKTVYNNIDFLSDEELEQMDKKFNYSFHGIYTNDTIRILKKELDEFSLSDDVIKVSKQDKNDALLQYKLEFLLNNLNIFNEDGFSVGYIEKVLYYAFLGTHIFSKEETKKIQFVNCISGYSRKNEDLISCILLTLNSGTFYYIYSEKDNKYVQKSEEDYEKLTKISYNPPRINFNTSR